MIILASLVIIVVIFTLLTRPKGTLITGDVNIDDITEENAATSSVPLSTRKLAIQAFQKAYETMTSNDAVKIRTQMLARAKNDAERAPIQSLSDADLLSLSSRIATMMKKPPVAILLDPSAQWEINRNLVTVSVFPPVAESTTTLSAVLVNGAWY